MHGVRHKPSPFLQFIYVYAILILMKNQNLIIQNAHIIDPANDVDQIGSITVKDGKILEISDTADDEKLSLGSYTVIDAKGFIAAPGLVDIHSHFRDPGQTYKEDIQTGAAAAAAGGYTSIVMMANTRPVVDNVEVLTDLRKRCTALDIHVYPSAAATMGLKGEQLTDTEELLKAGAVGITDDGIPILDEKVLREACNASARFMVPLSLHEENPAFIHEPGVNEGTSATHLGLIGASRMAEIAMIERDVNIAIETGAILNIQHISTKEGVEIVREAKRRSNRIHAEATPHHFSLTEEAVIEHGTLAKMNPPLRTREDRQAIIRGLADGTIDIIATDHAPHSEEEKSRPFTQAPSGIIGLETALSLGITNLCNTGALTFAELLRKLTINPAKMYGLNAGTLSIGAPADIVIFDPTATVTVEKGKSKSSNSPFIGCELAGRVLYTICDGKVVYGGRKSNG